MLDDDACYEALRANDARFDGLFFVGVSSTGIYCRSVCPAKLPKRENCTFFPTAAAAEAAGYRPCLKCRPELAPGQPATLEMDELAARAAAALRDGSASSVAALAASLGVSERHLRRVFEATWGVSPVRYRTTCRLLLAKSLLTETDLPVAQVARACGFSSTRRFEEAFGASYRLAPGRFRRQLAAGGAARTGAADGAAAGSVSFLLGYRAPYRYDELLAFLRFRAIEGVESVSDGVYKRTVRIGKSVGWIAVRNRPERSALELTVSESLYGHLPLVAAKARLLFDTDCDPRLIDEGLAGFHDRTGGAFRLEGVRLPCSFDGFEMTVRAILGQQITVKAANTLAGRVAAAFGTSLGSAGAPAPFEELSTLFPAPAAFCTAGAAERLGELGVIRQRARSICAVAEKLEAGALELRPGADVEANAEALLDVPGIGPWTVQYALMRAFAYPDAFPAADYAVKHAFPGLAPREIEALSRAWSPLRSYAVMSLWSEPLG